MASELPPLSPEDEALIERLAVRVIELHMEVPAILALETAKPVSVIASQALIFFEPMIQVMFRLSDYRRVTLLLERREVVEVFIRRIEHLAEKARADRDQLKRAARTQGGGRRG